MSDTMGREARCFICARVWPVAALYKLDAWDAMYYVCGPCVDLLKEHARVREERERDPEGLGPSLDDESISQSIVDDHFGRGREP